MAHSGLNPGRAGTMFRHMDLVTVYTALNPAEAELVRSRLEASDFLAVVKNENAALAIGGYSMAVGGILVQVPEDQADQARELLRSCQGQDPCPE